MSNKQQGKEVMDKPSKIDLFVDKLEQRNIDYFHKKIDLIKKIKVWLKDEIGSYDNFKDYIGDVDSFHDGIIEGRHECAESLYNQIKKWENGDD